MRACSSFTVFGETCGTRFLLTCPFFLAAPQPALPCCSGGETWARAGFERNFFICLEPQLPPLTCLNISTQACTKTGPLLFCPPAKAGQSLCPLCQWLCTHLFCPASILAAGAVWHGATWSGAWAGTMRALPSPCCPSCCPSCATAASRLRFDHAGCVGWPLPRGLVSCQQHLVHVLFTG